MTIDDVIAIADELADELDRFDETWCAAEELGHCDSFGGMQYCRIRREWLAAGCPGDVDLHSFIRLRANLGPMPA